MKTPGSKERGFTLPELLIVIVLLGIMAAIAIPVWWGVVESRNVDSATNQVAADLRLAHTSASNRLDTASVYFDARDFDRVVQCGGGNVDYCIVVPTTTGTEIRSGRLPDGIGIRIWNISTAPSAVNELGVTGAHRAIDFSPSGSATTRGSTNSTVTDCPSGSISGAPVIAIAPDGATYPERCIEINTQTSRVEVD